MVSRDIWPSGHQFATSDQMCKYAQTESFVYSRRSKKCFFDKAEYNQASEFQDLTVRCRTLIFFIIELLKVQVNYVGYIQLCNLLT